jgi:dipeptidase E
VNLYLSSYRLGDESKKLRELVSGPNVAVIRNALDFSEDTERLEAGLVKEFADMRSLGFDPEELDLRCYFGKRSELQNRLASFDAVWVVGGNAFILRRAMSMSGLESILRENEVPEDFTYSGYSAGICAVASTLRGIDLVDPPEVVPEGYSDEVIWGGLGLVPFAIASHYKSNHPESESINKVVAYYEKRNIEYIALRDGEVYVATI